MKTLTLIHKPLPQNPDIWVSVPDYKEPILPVRGGYGWYGLQAYDFQGDKLMCHECGEFRDKLGAHTKLHKLSSKEYKTKYGLAQGSKLTSTSHFEKCKANSLKNNLGDRGNRFIKGQVANTRSGKASPLEIKNRHDTCPNQLLRWLKDAANVYGDKITEQQANAFRTNLVVLLHKEFGSFNKAKQILQLESTRPGGDYRAIDKRIILEDMVAFYRHYKRWPGCSDYAKGKRPFSLSLISGNGGVRTLRQEAMKLKEEQDKKNKLAKNMPLMASKIEMEYAGKARV